MTARAPDARSRTIATTRRRGMLVLAAQLLCVASQFPLPAASGPALAQDNNATQVQTGQSPTLTTQPLVQTSQPPTLSTQPPVQTSQPPTLSTQLLAQTSQPPTLSTQPPAQTGQPRPLISQLPAQTTQPPKLTGQPPAQTNQPPAPTSQAPAQTGHPSAQVSQPPAQTADRAKSQSQPLQLIYRRAALPAGHVGVAYGPTRIVEGGVPPYTLTVIGKFPAGLALGADGMLTGTPLAEGSYHFQLTAQDSSVPSPVTTQQPYSLRVELNKAPAQSPPVTLTREEADFIANPNSGAPVTYLLTPAALERAVAGHSGSATAEANDDTAPATESSAGAATANKTEAQNTTATPNATTDAAPSAAVSAADTPAINMDQLKAVVAPVINVEYPSLFLFEAALEASRCDYYQQVLRQRAAGKPPIDLTCPPPPTTVKNTQNATAATVPGGKASNAPTPPAGPNAVLTLREYYDGLLPDTVRNSIVEAAETPHPPSGASPIKIAGNGCGCAPRNGPNEVYGFYPFWNATPASQPIDFSLFTRIAYMGVILNPTGDYTTPPNWLDQSGNFARTVHRFNTRLDLIVYRQEWSWLPALSGKQIQALAEQSARTAVGMIDAPLDGPFTLKPFWLPFWRESDHAYDGLTVYFEYPHDSSRFNAAAVEKFQLFLSEYLRQAVLAMQRSGRAYNLNIVVPDDLVGDEGPFSYRNLINYIELAEPPTTRKGTATEDDMADYKGTSPITVDLLVLMREPTMKQKKLFRAGADELEAPYDGHRRVALLQSLVPVIFHLGGPPPKSPVNLHGSNLDKDIAYYQWSYGGVGFWPVPVTTLGDGAAVISVVQKDVFAEKSGSGLGFKITAASDSLCRYVCPNRELVRLLFELLVLIAASLGGAYVVTCQVRRVAWVYLALLVASALALTSGGLLLDCDPTLHELKQGNSLLLGLIVGLGLFIVYKSYKPRVARP